MKQQVISILDEMIKENIRDNKIFFDEGHKIPEFHKSEKEILEKAKSRIQALGDGGKVPTITIPEGTVLIGKDEYELLKEKAWMYDDLCNS